MNYIPLIHTITDENIFSVLRQFLKTWYEIDLLQSDKEINFGNRLGITLSKNINDLLNLFTDLSNSIIYGNKKYIYSSFNYIFIDQRLVVSYSKKNDFLLLLQEGQRDFFYGIKKEDLLKDNPIIYRCIIDIKTKEVTYYKDLSLNNFIIKCICTNCSKLKTKSYKILLPKKDNLIKDKIDLIVSYFDYNTSFDKITFLESNDTIASIYNDESSDYNLLEINKWTEKQKEITEKAINIFDWNGWSDNSHRFKL
ncbi:hypothetical protein [Flavobacterium johnsoniae]|uniref:Uncharacterized protein n=1 Tax=Flavobacterium johnsoniae (strain ATCC 17061 / DSM 2064 / JCM 8514 / BCRC 14874 / CCUG 350202 / NBRC 14942 / NCIMB 11054 / UW101) TaxID=376686 RepID=A5FAT4_FLAJ1|nr:hypothetical protein [Flavobacterium johnsoniae]ABQ07685.1 hypothetical protein Fjoh_4686 [Flavobacterium johnsoniae UW101]OXG01769.1 hypothetical protein B0A63_03680 [Flavobacterium johnsoniae UW101]WQG80476.1 hypothetical protein SR927_20940 [Flavobacterium johnsoniae UW101]SHL05464.1 hypothetical protein SAMN05444146_2795 [Flavobacterium johnsoniae]